MVVVAAGLRSSLARLAVEPAEPGHALSDGAVATLYDQVRAITLGTAALLVVLGAVNAFIVASFAARDSARAHATLRALGATPRQTTATLVVSQLGPSLLAVTVGIPLGLALWGMQGGDLPAVAVPPAALAGIAVAVPLAVAAVVSVPARRLARRPAGPALADE
jgi:putative ABC transport system permease protein